MLFFNPFCLSGTSFLAIYILFVPNLSAQAETTKKLLQTNQVISSFKKVELAQYPLLDLPPFESMYNNNTPIENFDLGRKMLQQKKYRTASNYFTLAIDTSKDYVLAYIGRGVSRTYLGEFKKAIEDFNKAIEINPDLPNAYHLRGLVYTQLGKNNLALNDWEKAVNLYEKEKNLEQKQMVLDLINNL